jgi:hypothetical protein
MCIHVMQFNAHGKMLCNARSRWISEIENKFMNGTNYTLRVAIKNFPFAELLNNFLVFKKPKWLFPSSC